MRVGLSVIKRGAHREPLEPTAAVLEPGLRKRGKSGTAGARSKFQTARQNIVAEMKRNPSSAERKTEYKREGRRGDVKKAKKG